MEIKHFGNPQGASVMLLPGNFMCWRQFEDVIPLLEKEYSVYAVSFDGFDGTGTTTYTTAQAQADKLEDFLRAELGGHLDLLFAESLGCGPAVLLKSAPGVQIDHMILSGPEYLDFGCLNRLLLKIMPPKQYETARKKTMPAWALRFMGQTEQGMQTMLRRIPENISLESVRATWEAGLYLYRTNFPVQPEADVACWYGEKEGHMKKAILRLRKAYPQLRGRCFPGFGHGDIINYPQLLVSKLTQLLRDPAT
ncbi:MAG: alpha/beta hydrolase [Clostridiales bacterium]|nr:alpha/beta hydrolase [Clostridiales bacterium]